MDDQNQSMMFTGAQAYERFMGRWSRLLAERFARFLDVRDGEDVLDIGSGTGALARAILAVAPGARVTGIDPSPAFLAAAREAFGSAVRFEVGDAQHLAYEQGAFDVCCGQLVLNFIPDQKAALAEMHRVTKPGGRIAAAIWDHAEGMLMLRTFWEVVDDMDPEPRDEDPNRLLDRDGLNELWQAAGLIDIETTALVIEMPFVSWSDYWDPFLLAQGPAGAYLQTIDDGKRAAIARALRHRLLPNNADGPFTLTARAWAIRGVRG